MGRRPRPAGLLASLSTPANRPRVPCLRRACRLQPAHLVGWRPIAASGDAGSLVHAPRNPSGLPEAVAVWAALASLASRRSPPGIAVPDDRPAHVRRQTSHPHAHPPSAAGGRRSLRFVQQQRHVRQQDASRDCQEWCVFQTFLTGQRLQGQYPPRMLCLLERAASVRTHAYARGRVRVCVCVCACVGLHEPHHSTTEGDIKRQRTYEPENTITKPQDVPKSE